MDFVNARKFIKETYETLSSIPTVGGDIKNSAELIKKAVSDVTDVFFDKVFAPHGGGLVFVHSCGKENPKKLLLDAHMDTVGFVVSELFGDGFVAVTPVGGIDKRLLPASEVEIYAKQTVPGIFVSKPGHLKNFADKDDRTLFVDTGLSKKDLYDLVSVGDMCGFRTKPFEMTGDILCGKSMDDKICATAILLFAKLLCEDSNYKDECDIIFSFSTGEESGCAPTEYLSDLCPDAAIVLDVNFAREKGVPEYLSYEMGQGCGISYSVTTSRALTDALAGCAKKNRIELSTMVETLNTGTNAHRFAVSGKGVPTAVLSIPEKYMHQSYEAVNFHDVVSCAELLCAFTREFSEKQGSFIKEPLKKKA